MNQGASASLAVERDSDGGGTERPAAIRQRNEADVTLAVAVFGYLFPGRPGCCLELQTPTAWFAATSRFANDQFRSETACSDTEGCD